MIIKDDDLTVVHSLSLLSGVDENDIQKVFEAFLLEFSFACTNNKPAHIPFIGNILVRYKEDIITNEGKEAVVDAFYAPHDEVKRLVGQLQDIADTNDFTQFDGFSIMKKILKNDFKLSFDKELLRD